MSMLITTIIFFASAIGIGIILKRKASLVAELPNNQSLFNIGQFYSGLKDKAVGTARPFKEGSLDALLQIALSKTRVLLLKLEGKLASWLQHLRKNSHERKTKTEDNYWQKLNGSDNNQKQERPQP